MFYGDCMYRHLILYVLYDKLAVWCNLKENLLSDCIFLIYNFTVKTAMLSIEDGALCPGKMTYEKNLLVGGIFYIICRP